MRSFFRRRRQESEGADAGSIDASVAEMLAADADAARAADDAEPMAVGDDAHRLRQAAAVFSPRPAPVRDAWRPRPDDRAPRFRPPGDPPRTEPGPDMRGPAVRALRPAEPADRVAQRPDPETELPSFRMPVAGALRGAPAPSGPIPPETHAALREAFTPTRPKSQVNALFIGRLQILRRIIQAVEEERAHVVLFGDRGRGKTSVANAIQQIASNAGYLTVKLTCSAELDFEDVFRRLLNRIPSTYHQAGMDNPFSARRSFGSFDELLPPGPFSATELQEVLSSVSGTHVLLILDEYDRVTGPDMRNKLAELLKNLTDAAVPVTLLIVGVAETVSQLLGAHPSIQRSLVAVHLPLMTDREVERLIQAGAEAARVDFPADVRERIVLLSRGLPYYAQLLSLYTARNALGRGARRIEAGDLAYAVERCAAEADRAVADAYNRAVGTDRRTSFTDVLYLAALCPADEYGVFHPADMARIPLHPDGEPGSVLGLQYPLSRLCEEERGAVIERVQEAGGFRYRFRHQMMRQHVLMRQARARGLV
jgi:Cdc6-like AAA superfamily ATPase